MFPCECSTFHLPQALVGDIDDEELKPPLTFEELMFLGVEAEEELQKRSSQVDDSDT